MGSEPWRSGIVGPVNEGEGGGICPDVPSCCQTGTVIPLTADHNYA